MTYAPDRFQSTPGYRSASRIARKDFLAANSRLIWPWHVSLFTFTFYPRRNGTGLLPETPVLPRKIFLIAIASFERQHERSSGNKSFS
jgi:hypothetical protein